jgi:ribosomal-protein-alanine N-acetyltransferase
MVELTFRAGEDRDAQRLMWLAEGSPGAPHWTAATWDGVFVSAAEGQQRVVVIAEHRGEAVGFGVVGMRGDDAEIESVAVIAAWRRQRVGMWLCEQMMAWARERGAARMLLEVRVSNAAARALYASLGFQEEAVRRLYYRQPEEDAVMMARAL